jgi:hypothetical protein
MGAFIVDISIRIQVRQLAEFPARPIERPTECPNGAEPRKRGACPSTRRF